MKIDFKQLTRNADINMKQLAEEMVAAGHFNNRLTAYITIQNFNHGRGKSIKLDLLLWIRRRFNVDITEFFKW